MSDIATLVAKDQVSTCIHDLFIGTDRRDWSLVRGCFTESVAFDMTSVAGGEPQRLTPAQITDGWETGLQPLEQVHHQVGNLQISIDGTRATAFCYGIALHYRTTREGNNVRRFVGTYDFGLEYQTGLWRISALRFNLKFIDG
ncbi:MAG: nuclear transport factor 2 family protein, partial [Gemmatimonadota bacterium]